MQNDRRSTKNILVVPFIILLFCCSGCFTDTTNDKNTSTKDTLIFGVLSADMIYPLGVTDYNYWSLIPNIFNGLVEYDDQFRIVPSLAVSWNLYNIRAV